MSKTKGERMHDRHQARLKVAYPDDAWDCDWTIYVFVVSQLKNYLKHRATIIDLPASTEAKIHTIIKALETHMEPGVREMAEVAEDERRIHSAFCMLGKILPALWN